jgi:hypothetical protein
MNYGEWIRKIYRTSRADRKLFVGRRLLFCQFAKPRQDRKRSKHLEQYGSDKDYGHIA